MEGGCFCGAIRYLATGAFCNEGNCHCSLCRKTTGAPFVSWFSVLTENFSFTKGLPTSFKSSERGTRTFCPTCGTQLTFKLDDSETIDLTICSLDNAEAVQPKAHGFVSSKLSWITLNDELPQNSEDY